MHVLDRDLLLALAAVTIERVEQYRIGARELVGLAQVLAPALEGLFPDHGPSIAMPNTEASFAELKTRLAKTIEYCKTFKPAQIDGTEDKDITIKLGANERKFSGQGLLQNFILPNFYFHCTTAYDILRHCGVELGKRDFMGTPVNL
jgi:Domain of unknown function (DUF1993)